MKVFGRIVDGALVATVESETDDIAPAGMTELSDWKGWSQAPTRAHRMVNVAGVWLWRDDRTLAETKADKWAELKQARNAAVQAPVSTPFGVFDADDAAQANITKRVLMINNIPAVSLPTTIEFTRHDNTVATLTPAQMVQVGLLLGAQVEAAFAKGRALRAATEDAKDVAAVAAIKW